MSQGACQSRTRSQPEAKQGVTGLKRTQAGLELAPEAEVLVLSGPVLILGTGLQLFFFLFRAALMAYGGCQAKVRIKAVAAGLRHSLSNLGSKPCLQPPPQLTATLDP